MFRLLVHRPRRHVESISFSEDGDFAPLVRHDYVPAFAPMSVTLHSLPFVKLRNG